MIKTLSQHYFVRDWMRTEVKTASPSTTISEMVTLMLEQKTNGIVIVDADQKVVGILSSWDIIQYIVPDYLEEDKHLASFESADTFALRIKQVADDPVSKCMTKEVKIIHPDDPLMEAITLLSEFHIRQLPVVDDSGTLVGYLNRTDIKRAVGNVYGAQD